MFRILILLSINVVFFVSVIETTRRGTYQSNSRNSNSRNGSPVDCSTGFYIKKNPRSCTSFYKCANGKPVLTQCPAGTEFSESLSQCTYPADAECKVETPSSGSGSQGSSNNRPASQQVQNQQQSRPGNGNNQGQNNNGGGNNQGRQDPGKGSSSSNGNSNGKFYYDMVFADF